MERILRYYNFCAKWLLLLNVISIVVVAFFLILFGSALFDVTAANFVRVLSANALFYFYSILLIKRTSEIGFLLGSIGVLLGSAALGFKLTQSRTDEKKVLIYGFLLMIASTIAAYFVLVAWVYDL